MEILTMNTTTLHQILIVFFTLSITVTTGLDWRCETVTNTPCIYPTTVSGVGRKDHYYKGSTSWTCTDRNRIVYGTYDVSRNTITNDAVFAISKCMDINYRPQVPATPCIIDFKLCIEDPHVSAMTLKCRYLKGLNQIVNQDFSPDSQNATCVTDGIVHTYYMNTGYSTTKVEYNNEKIRFEKPILPDS